MDDIFLTLSLQFLGIEDAFRSSIVCRDWRHFVMSNDEIWKAVATNDLPQIMEATSDRPNLNYKKIVDGLICKATTNDPWFQEDNDPNHCISRNKNPNSSLEADDILLIVELNDKQSGKRIGTWCDNFSSFVESKNSTGYSLSLCDSLQDGVSKIRLPIRLDGLIEEHFDECWMIQNGCLADIVPTTVYQSLVHTVRLIRLDNSQHYSVQMGCPYSDKELINLMQPTRSTIHHRRHHHAFPGRDMVRSQSMDRGSDDSTTMIAFSIPVLRGVQKKQIPCARSHLHMGISMSVFPDPDNYWCGWKEAQYMLSSLTVEIMHDNLREAVNTLDDLNWK